MLAALISSLLLVAPASAADIDTFYLRLFQDGAELAAAGQYGEAVGKLRLACFGMLDHPAVLGPCLGRLLATQELASDAEDEIEATVDRLLEVEKRFKGWTEPEPRFAPSSDLRRRVDALFVRFGTADSLARVPGLGDAALEKQISQVARLPLEERRKELNLLVQRQAQIPIWHVMSAELSLEEGDPRAAAGAAGEILRKFEGNAAARCVLGRAQAEQTQCQSETIEHLRMCPADHAERLEIDLALLTCLVEAKRWSEADAVWNRLPTTERDERPVRRLRKQIDKNLETGGASSAESGDASASGGGAGFGGVDSSAEPDRVAETTPVAEATRTPKAASTPRAPVYAPPPGLDEEPQGDKEPVETAETQEPSQLGDLPDEAQATLQRVRDALALEQRQLYDELWAPTRKVAKKHDESAVAQRLAGSLAFRLSRWRDAIRFYRRDESLATTRPQLQLELAVALHYQGEREEARSEFELCRPLLPASAWVEYWAAEFGA